MIRIGINRHPKVRAGQDWSAEEKAYLPAFMQALNPSAVVIMGTGGVGKSEFHEALALHDMLLNTTIIYRHYHDAEGHLFKLLSPYDYIKGMRHVTDPRLPLYILNEPNAKAPVEDNADGPGLRSQMKWCAEVLRILALEGQPCVIRNDGAGLPPEQWFTKDEYWEAVHPFFDALKVAPLAEWGLHPYWGQNGLRPEEGQSSRHKLIAQLLKEKRGYDMPPIMLTEVGRDRYGSTKFNGWLSSGTSEETYASEFEEAQVTLWDEPYIRGVAAFCWGSTEERWRPFDISQAKEVLHKRLIAANQRAIKPPEPVQEPPPVPVEVFNWIPSPAQITGVQAIMMRPAPVYDDRPGLETIRSGDMIEYEGEAVNGFWHVRVKGKVGYAASTFFKPAVLQLPEERPADEPASTLPKSYTLTEDQYNRIVTAQKAAEKALAELQGLLTSITPSASL